MNVQKSLLPNTSFQAINVIQSATWIALAAFVDHAINFNPTNDADLREAAEMSASDPIPVEVQNTVKIYAALAVACETWQKVTYKGASELCQDILRHKDECTLSYDRIKAIIENAEPGKKFDAALDALQKDLQSASPSPAAKAACQQMARIVGWLSTQAKLRYDKADALLTGMTKFEDAIGVANGALTLQLPAYTKKFGEESQEVKDLVAKVDLLQKQISALRVKEQQEIIVLETTPTYLAVAWFFPFVVLIMAGVLAGVGADLANIRNQISGLMEDLKKTAGKLTTDKAFLAYHKWGLAKVKETIEQTAAAKKNIGAVKVAWGLIVSDLNDLQGRLLKQAEANVSTGDLFVLDLNLDSAKAEWARLAAEATGYLQFQMISGKAGTKTVEEAMRGVTVKKAA